ncbi:MAG: ZIP family metal transporter [Burkholderiales bacterium]
MTLFNAANRRWLETHGPLAGVAAGLALVMAAGIYLASVTDAALLRTAGAVPAVAVALLATLGTAFATGAGALPVLFARTFAPKAQNAMLGFSAGVMLAASMFSLLLPALDSATAMTESKVAGGLVACAGLILGVALMLAMDRWLPHEHLVQGHHGPDAQRISRVWLFVFAITLHNLPEGLAVGVAFGAGEATHAVPLAIGIGIQNMPEGLAVALALLTLNFSPAKATLLALASGMVEPLGGVLGAGVISIMQPMLPLGLSFAAGAMLFVISHEIIPETHHQKGHETVATVSLMVGFIIMMMFDTILA